MPKYSKKIQMLLTDDQYQELEKIASKEHKKLGTLVREAVVEYHLKNAKQRRIADAVDRLLSLPEVEAPVNWDDFEKELAQAHGFHD
ncbi:MAG: hypothetical protein AB1585_19090 [Thermodesulfobacteriota bacterium]